MLKLEHLPDLSQELIRVGKDGVINTLHWFLSHRSNWMRRSFKRMHIDYYAVTVAKKEMLPTYVSHPEEGVQIIAHFRMRHNI